VIIELTSTLFSVTPDSMAVVTGIIRDTGFAEVPCDQKYAAKRWKNHTTHVTLYHTMQVRVSGNGGIVYHRLINRFRTAMINHHG